MTLRQRVTFAIVVAIANVASVLVVVPLGLWLAPYGYNVAFAVLAGMLTGGVAVLIGMAVARMSSANCSITALTVAVIADIALVSGLVGTGGIDWAKSHGVNGSTTVLALFSVHCLVLIGATYWHSSPVVRIVETAIATAAWLLFLGLRVSGRWQFDLSGFSQPDAAQARVAAVVGLIATSPLVFLLWRTFVRDSRRQPARLG